MTTGRELTHYDAKYAAQAAQYAEQEVVTGGTFLSTRGGTLSFGDEVMPGNQACVIILDAVMENTYYEGEYVADEPQAPTCYAFGRNVTEMAPHPSMQVDLSYFKPQHDTCQGCQWNEWGTADKGRGKACQNRRRLALVPAGYYSPRRASRDFDLDIFTDPKHFERADMAYLKTSVTSTREFSKYVNQLASTHNRPPHGVITRLWLEPHPKYQHVCYFEMLELVPDELFDIIQGRHEEALKAVVQGYTPPDEQQTQPAARGSLRGLRRGR